MTYLEVYFIQMCKLCFSLPDTVHHRVTRKNNLICQQNWDFPFQPLSGITSGRIAGGSTDPLD
jgi:hypothetical protein